MNNDLKIKIYGEDTTNLFLAFLLLKSGFKVKISKNYNISKKTKEKYFFISNSSKLLLDNFNLWSQLKNKACSIESLIVTDTSFTNEIDLTIRDFNFIKPNTINIGWILDECDFYNLLLNEISKFNNVFCESSFNGNFEMKDSYINLISNLIEKFFKRIFKLIFSKNNNSSIEFTASLRGFINNRYYSIISENGLTLLCPINKNLFRVKWIIKKSLLARTLTIGKSFLLDNLSTILPKELKIDEIHGDLDITPANPDMFQRPSKNSHLIINKGSVKLLNLSLKDLNLSFNDVIYIYNHIRSIDFKNVKEYFLLKFKFFIYFKLKISSVFYGFYKLNIHSSYFFKKIIFYLVKKVRIIRKFILKFIILNFY